MVDLDKAIAHKYNLEVKGIAPYKDMYILNTVAGKKLIKKMTCAPERIMFIHGAKEHLYANGFTNVDRYICTDEEKPYVILEDGIYAMIDMLDGRECNFDNRSDVINATHLLALMHKASKGYIPSPQSSLHDELGKLPSYFSKRLDEIKKMKKMAQKNRGRFDCTFLEYADYFYKLGEEALSRISCPEYFKLVQRTYEEGSFCHHDFTHHNIICKELETYLINFDYCCFELRVYDIANLLRRKMRKCNWDIEEAKTIIREYQHVDPLSENELSIMKLILQFPQKLWRVANKYYNSRHGLSEKIYMLKLEEVIEEIKYHKNFMDRYESLV